MIATLNIHLYPTDIRNESRMLRMTKTLGENGVFDQIELVGMRNTDLPHKQCLDGVRTIRRIGGIFDNSVNIFLRLLNVLSWMISVAYVYGKRDSKLICVNPHSLSTLPLAAFLKWRHKCKLLYDTHELETERADAGMIRKHFSKIVESLFIGSADQVITVGDCIADWYRQGYGLTNVHVVRNLPDLNGNRSRRAQSGAQGIRRRVQVSNENFLFVYVGLFGKGRGIECLIDAFRNLSNDHQLAFIGFGALKPLIEMAAKEVTNISCVDAVPSGEVVDVIKSADASIVFFENIGLSYYYSCPNKLFESLAAGLPVIINDLPEMRKVVEDGGAGWVMNEDGSNLKQVLLEISKTDLRNARIGALDWTERNSWQREKQRLLQPYKEMGFIDL